MFGVQLLGVCKQYGHHRAVDALDLSINPGEFMTLLGPSGCGKTTTLRMVAGFEIPSSGTIKISDRDVTRVPPNNRNTGMVFQSYALFPHLTVRENIAFGLKVRNVSGESIRERVQNAIQLVRLEGLESRLPRHLSGGQQQRVALARAVVINPHVLLLDEPLSALDMQLRHELQIHIRRVQQALGVTTIYVTHDQGEALRMSDRIAVMRQGRIAQLDAPRDLYRRPNSAFVAKFIGQSNVVNIDILGYDANSGIYTVALPGVEEVRLHVVADPRLAFTPSTQASLVVRPEVVRLGHEYENVMSGIIDSISYSGSIWNASVTCSTSNKLDLEFSYATTPLSVGDRIEFSFKAEDCHLVRCESE